MPGLECNYVLFLYKFKIYAKYLINNSIFILNSVTRYENICNVFHLIFIKISNKKNNNSPSCRFKMVTKLPDIMKLKLLFSIISLQWILRFSV